MFTHRFLVAFVILSLSATQAIAQTQLEVTGLTMGPIPYKVIIGHYPESVEPTELQQSVESALERVNQLMSTYIPDSDVSQFNASSSTDFIEVNSETATVVARALEISQQTGGAFDITVGPAVNLWKFGPDKNDFAVPSDDAIAKVAELVGYQKVSVRLDPPAIKKEIPNLKIDLSAIAKGYAVDQVAKSLDDLGCEKFMVEVGGEVFTRGERTAGGKWRIAVERPSDRGRAIGSVAEISDQGMATSGDYRNFKKADGKRYSHTIDPTTCRPVKHNLASACIIADDCMTADAIATAIMVLGVKKGQEFCEQKGIEYALVERDSDFGNKLTEFQSGSFPLKKKAQPQAGSEQSILPIFIGAAVVFGLVILGMAVGSIFANKPVQGSCGGLANMTNEDGDEVCGICSKPTTDCIEKVAEATT